MKTLTPFRHWQKNHPRSTDPDEQERLAWNGGVRAVQDGARVAMETGALTGLTLLVIELLEDEP